MNKSIQYFLQQNLDTFLKAASNVDPRIKEMFEGLTEPKYYIGDLGIDRNTFTYWLQKGLIPYQDIKGSEGWRKFSFLESVWLKVILEFRDLGVGVDKIKIAKDALFDSKVFAEKILEVLNDNSRSHLFNADGAQKMKSSSLKEIQKQIEAFKFLMFDLVIVVTLVGKQGYSLSMENDGGVRLIPLGKMSRQIKLTNALDDLQELLSSSFVSINIWPLILDLLFKEGIKVSNELTNYILTKEEQNILKAIRSGNYTEIVIKMYKKREPDRLQLKKDGIDQKTLRKLYHYLKKGKYEHISFKTRAGQLISYQESEVVKLKI